MGCFTVGGAAKRACMLGEAVPGRRLRHGPAECGAELALLRRGGQRGRVHGAASGTQPWVCDLLA
jgi:hypothetical protein